VSVFFLEKSGNPTRKSFLDSICTIGLVESPMCEDCEIEDETVKHYLLDCPAHEDARRPLRAKFGRRKAGDIRFLLTSPDA
jgi:hypothetical protein